LKAKSLVLRTHGGLGNQLFQILYARLLAEKEGLELRETHDLHYPHAFPRTTKILICRAPSLWQTVLSTMRVPKVLGRFLGRPEAPWRWAGTVYADGYFQRAVQYTIFDHRCIAQQIAKLAEELNIQQPADSRRLVHIRLGDFFENYESARQHAKKRIVAIPSGSHVMSNDEALLRTPSIAEELIHKNITLVSTYGADAEEVIQRMASFSHIDANDSTLAFWASILGGGSLQLSNELLRQSHEFFRYVIDR
jgi:hypothetical protein